MRALRTAGMLAAVAATLLIAAAAWPIVAAIIQNRLQTGDEP